MEFTNKFSTKRRAGDDEGYVQAFDVSFIPVRSGTYVININDGIRCVAQFDYAIQALNMANEDDQVEIRLQCPGGSLDATDALIHAMRSCKADIHTIATGNCSSAASAILLESHSFELSDGFSSLIHCGSLGAGGAFNEFNASTKFHQEFMPNWMRKTYQGFLSEDEIEALIKGQDIWLNAEQWGTRYEQRNEWIAKRIEAMMAPDEIVIDAEDNAQAIEDGFKRLFGTTEEKAPAKKPRKKPAKKDIDTNLEL